MYRAGQSFQDPETQAQEPARIRRSPAASQLSNSPCDNHAMFTVSVKVLSPSNKKDFKMYTLRYVVLSAMKRPDDIKNEILEQIGGQVVPETLEFDLSYYMGKEKKWINNQDDACDALDILKSQNKLTLWCTGISLEKEKKEEGP